MYNIGVNFVIKYLVFELEFTFLFLIFWVDTRGNWIIDIKLKARRAAKIATLRALFLIIFVFEYCVVFINFFKSRCLAQGQACVYQ